MTEIGGTRNTENEGGARCKGREEVRIGSPCKVKTGLAKLRYSGHLDISASALSDVLTWEDYNMQHYLYM